MGIVQIVTPPVAEVELISWTLAPVETIAKVARTYEHNLSSEATSAEYEAKCLEQLQKTELQGPLEMVTFVWLIRNVTRAFTHQLVRYRIGTSFAQESLRFSEKRDAKVLCTVPEGLGSGAYLESAIDSLETYWRLLDAGVPAEDARGILPTNILTSLFFHCSLRTLLHVYEQRQCEQAQSSEWPVVLSQMKELMPDERLKPLLTMRCERGGECLFRSKWDRPCPLRRKRG